MRRVSLLAAALPFAAACATIPADVEDPGATGPCDAASLGDLVGQAPTRELGTEAMRRSGARSLRWIRPGDAVTMDYRPDRLNVRLDARHRVEAFSCG